MYCGAQVSSLAQRQRGHLAQRLADGYTLLFNYPQVRPSSSSGVPGATQPNAGLASFVKVCFSFLARCLVSPSSGCPGDYRVAFFLEIDLGDSPTQENHFELGEEVRNQKSEI